MNDSDITKLENHLMKKHGILSIEGMEEFVARQNNIRTKPLIMGPHLVEDEWKRQAHALIENGLPDNSEDWIPLRVAANHRSLAWQRTNETTGSSVVIQRIGTKNGNGSSDW